jgi:hypothetical protein
MAPGRCQDSALYTYVDSKQALLYLALARAVQPEIVAGLPVPVTAPPCIATGTPTRRCSTTTPAARRSGTSSWPPSSPPPSSRADVCDVTRVRGLVPGPHKIWLAGR